MCCQQLLEGKKRKDKMYGSIFDNINIERGEGIKAKALLTPFIDALLKLIRIVIYFH